MSFLHEEDPFSLRSSGLFLLFVGVLCYLLRALRDGRW